MNVFERIEAKSFIKTAESKLIGDWQNKFDEWKNIRDRIARELKLSEDEIMLITKQMAAYMVAIQIRDRLGLTEENKEVIAKRVGITRLLEEAARYSKIGEELQQKNPVLFNKFNRRYDMLMGIDKRKPSRR